MGIAASVLKAVRDESARYPGQHAVKVGLRIGEFAGVDTESLRFCFEALSLADHKDPLDMDVQWCTVQDGWNGEELDIAYLQLEDDLMETPA